MILQLINLFKFYEFLLFNIFTSCIMIILRNQLEKVTKFLLFLYL